MRETPAVTPNDFGNHLEFLRALESESEFCLSWLREEFTHHEDWSAMARAVVEDHLLYSPAMVDLAPRVVDRVDCGDYFREKVEFSACSYSRIPAYVLIPKGGVAPYPGVVALHDHGSMFYWGKEKLVSTEADGNPVLRGFKEMLYEGVSVADELARRGYVVAVIDMLFWGERRTDFRLVTHLKDRMPAEADPEKMARRHNHLANHYIETFGRGLFQTGHTWAGIMVWEDRRTVDYLLSRPEVDPNRIACLGLSMGGFRTNLLASLDERVRAAVSVGWITTLRETFPHHFYSTMGWMKIIPGLHKCLDLTDVMALIPPRRLLVIDGEKDPLFSREGVRDAHSQLRRGFAKAGAAESLQLSSYPQGHVFNRPMQEEALEFLERALR